MQTAGQLQAILTPEVTVIGKGKKIAENRPIIFAKWVITFTGGFELNSKIDRSVNNKISLQTIKPGRMCVKAGL